MVLFQDKCSFLAHLYGGKVLPVVSDILPNKVISLDEVFAWLLFNESCSVHVLLNVRRILKRLCYICIRLRLYLLSTCTTNILQQNQEVDMRLVVQF